MLSSLGAEGGGCTWAQAAVTQGEMRGDVVLLWEGEGVAFLLPGVELTASWRYFAWNLSLEEPSARGVDAHLPLSPCCPGDWNRRDLGLLCTDLKDRVENCYHRRPLRIGKAWSQNKALPSHLPIRAP